MCSFKNRIINYVTSSDTQTFHIPRLNSAVLQWTYFLNKGGGGETWQSLISSSQWQRDVWRLVGTGAGHCPEDRVGWCSFPLEVPYGVFFLESSFRCCGLQCPFNDGKATDISGPGLDWMTSVLSVFPLKNVMTLQYKRFFIYRYDDFLRLLEKMGKEWVV